MSRETKVSAKEGTVAPGSSPVFRTGKGETEYLTAYDDTLTLWPISHGAMDVRTRFGSTHIIVSGPQDAPPLVLLHGMYTSSTMWFPNIGDLSGALRVYAVDTMGEPGKSTPDLRIRNRTESAEWLAGLFDHLGLERPSILGLSRGGWLALNLALCAQSRVSRIVLLSPAGAFIPLRIGFFADVFPALLLRSRASVDRALRSCSAKGCAMNEVFAEQFYMAFRHFRLSSAGGVMPTVFSDRELSSLKLPTLLLIGDRDSVNNQESLERARRLIDKVEVGVIDTAGHFLSMDQPEAVDRRIIEFLLGGK